ncbi:hypothetical protein H5T88_03705 [bacterium]|nr:hypothetical protein [bacterium]
MDYMSLINTLNDFTLPNPHNWSKKKWREFMAEIENVALILPYFCPYFRFLLKPNRTNRGLFTSYKEAILSIGKLYKEAKLTSPPQEKESRILKYFTPFEEDSPRALFKENSFGKILVENLFIPYESFLATFERECNRAFSASALTCVFALKAYKRDNLLCR